ncbi:MAG: PEP/pyruvate-binding domain-containing protein, partial [Candidatus Binatia bacterium]
MPDTLWFDNIGKEDIGLVGGKNASLGELLRAGIPVPPGFFVTTRAYDRFLEEGKIRADMDNILKTIDPEEVETVNAASSEIHALINKLPLSPELEDDIGECYRRLSQRCHELAVPVAVRSSATAEDLPRASFAGQQETYLWVRGIDDLLLHIRKCWSSLFTPRAISYREKIGFPHENV